MPSHKQKTTGDGDHHPRRRVSFSEHVHNSDGQFTRLRASSVLSGHSGNEPENRSESLANAEIRGPPARNQASQPRSDTFHPSISARDPESRDRNANTNKERDEQSYPGNRDPYHGGNPLSTHGPRSRFSQNHPTTSPSQAHHANNSRVSSSTAPIPNHSPSNMSGDSYSHREPPCYGVHFQPQVPDTTNGPYVHTYIPRHDMGGAYLGQPGFPVATAGVAYPMQTQVAYGMTPMGMGPMVMQQPVPAGMMLPSPSMPMPMAGGPMGGPVAMHGGPQIAPGNFGPMFASQPMMASAMPGVAVQGGPPCVPEPATGLGATASEVQWSYAAMAADPENEINQPQDIKPADDSKTRMYWCREVDGNWTIRNRVTLDNLEDTRWYLTDDGIFYAVRLPS